MNSDETDKSKGDDNSLEGNVTVTESEPANSSPATKTETKTKKASPLKNKKLLSRFNIYLLLFVLVIIIAGGVFVVSYFEGHKSPQKVTTNPQSLSQSQLSQIASGDNNIGSSSQILNIQSNTVFSNGVLIRGNLQVAGSIQVGNSLSLPSITVTGQSSLNQLKAGSLAVSSSAAIAGQLTVQGGLNVTGSVAFTGNVSAGQLAVNSLILGSDLQIAHHITTTGSAPTKSDGTALGNGGSSSLNGDDTAGTIDINTGTSPAAGCFVSISFAHSFPTHPHVIITPVGSSAGGLAYYINDSTTGFSICTATPATAEVSFGFNYFVVD